MQTAAREEQLRQWIRLSPENDTLKYENEVMWGVAFNLDDESQAPVAFFSTEEDARAYATLVGRAEWHVGPYVLSIRGRNDFDVPAEGK